jgi:hypothetical protein
MTSRRELRAALTLSAVLFIACLPAGHELEGKACSAVHPCPAPLFCLDNACSSTPLVEDAGNPDGGSWVATITALNLINATTGQAIFPYAPLNDGDSFPRSLITGKGISLLAITAPQVVTAVDFSLFGTLRLTRTENNAPYYFMGDAADGGITGWKPDAGTYRLQVTPFVGLEAGETKIVSFTITP